MIGDIFGALIGMGLLGSVITMLRFSKYCGLLNQRWKLDQETADRYQRKAQQYLAATGCLLAVSVASIILGVILF